MLHFKVFNKQCQHYASTSAFTHTILMPDFSRMSSILTLTDIKRQVIEQPRIEAHCYKWQQSRGSLPSFTLLDGPPYANGDVHVGHALNKILKDTIVRYKIMRGHRVTHQPGWDCHGLPIEMSVIKSAATNLTIAEHRQQCRNRAAHYIEKQMNSFKSWSLISDFNHPYLTYNPQYISRVLQLLGIMMDNKLIYRRRQPVFWSPSTGTALAEAELEYKDDHMSTAVFLSVPVVNMPGVEALIWTTTPWTLPLNDRIAFSDKIEYVLVTIKNAENRNTNSDHTLHIISRNAVPRLQQLVPHIQIDIQSKFDATKLYDSNYVHPYRKDKSENFVLSNHVQDDIGTGLVHVSFAHGRDDAALAKKLNQPIESFVDAQGKYTQHLGEELFGKEVLGNGQEIVLEKLRDNIVHTHKYTHSYPYDWRSKQPIITRSSVQWFIDIEPIRSTALQLVDMIKTQYTAKERLLQMIENRPDWCISRQRSWGTPLPYFCVLDENYDEESSQVIYSGELCRRIGEKIVKDGTSDTWWANPDQNYLVDNEMKRVRAGTNTLDVWFDSGAAWYASSNFPITADVICEGVDQLRGWFQALIWTKAAHIICTGAKIEPPYRSMLVHGFTVDQHLHKMSKSLGNVITPHEIIQGSKKLSHTFSKHRFATFKGVGLDAIRYWATSMGTAKSYRNVQLSTDIASTILKKIQRFHRFFAYVLSLPTKSKDNDDVFEQCLVDRLMHAQLDNLIKQSTDVMEDFHFARAIELIECFIFGDSEELSTNFICPVNLNRYIQVKRDTLNCEPIDSPTRMATIKTLLTCTYACVKMLGPIMPNLTNECAQKMWDNKIILESCWPERTHSTEMVENTALINNAEWIRKYILDLVNKEIIENMARPEASLIYVQLAIDFYRKFEQIPNYLELLREMTNVAEISIKPIESHVTTVECQRTNYDHCARCRRFIETQHINGHSLCQRCDNVMKKYYR